MSRTDIKNSLSVAQTLVPAARTANATGTDVDLANYDAAAVVIAVGAVSDDGFSFEIQHADDDGSGSPDSYTAVPDAELDGTEPTTAVASAVTVIGYHGIKRWLTVVATDTGTGDAAFGVSVIRAKGRVKP